MNAAVKSLPQMPTSHDAADWSLYRVDLDEWRERSLRRLSAMAGNGRDVDRARGFVEVQYLMNRAIGDQLIADDKPADYRPDPSIAAEYERRFAADCADRCVAYEPPPAARVELVGAS